MSEWLSPSDPWPRHRYPEAQKALAEARHAGWWLKRAGGSAHGYGVLYCRRTSGEEYCKFPVFTTAGSDREATAHHIRERLAKCQHERESAEVGAGEAQLHDRSLRGVYFHLDRADRVVTALEGLLSHHGLRSRATRLLSDGTDDADEAERLLSRVQELDEEAAAAADTARQEADAASMGSSPWPPEEQELEARFADPARADLDEAEAILQGAAGQEATSAGARLATLRERLGRCRTQLASMDN